MKKLIFLISIIITSCSPYIRSDFSRNYASLTSNDSIKVLSPEIYLNRNNSRDLKIGTIIIGDKGATKNCDSITMLNIIKDSARVHGADLIGLTKHIKPSFWGSTCHQFSADFLRENVIKIDSSNQEYITLAEKIKKENSYNKFLFTYEASYLYRTVKEDNSNEFNQKVSKLLKNGYGMSFAAYYNNIKNSGFGLKYKIMKYGGELGNAFISFDDGRSTENGTLSIDANVNYFALSGRSDFRFGQKQKNNFYFEYSVGYASYNERSGINTKIKTTGGNIGYDFNFGYLRNINSSCEIGLNLGYFASNISQLTIDNGRETNTFNLEKSEALNLNNLNIGVVLTYGL
ncbi:hypothetical protein QVZ41_02695 [Wenyingzhuangia sp. chi5]|uniref:Outer membrane protein beta-barrel domain-containing protein n=1 Tax=Wenyingzhuangia gilva TaxID=3057677 RepID=A0ABT8VP52_9FLAO|nr:hypothetical protein [Wenyingzhuangia sp. chi5]MDO3693755.1 hypothetical protein [Wenyingzhuangia sp. chi5]